MVREDGRDPGRVLITGPRQFVGQVFAGDGLLLYTTLCILAMPLPAPCAVRHAEHRAICHRRFAVWEKGLRPV